MTPTGPPPTASAGGGAVGAVRRKPARRANTAERRATHNAVERQRRETLNSRFLVSSRFHPPPLLRRSFDFGKHTDCVLQMHS